MKKTQMQLLTGPQQLSLFAERCPQAVQLSDVTTVLTVLWDLLRQNYFPSHPGIEKYTVRWSNRKQTTSLASCNTRTKTVNVAYAMSHPNCRQYLEPLLYHEMCHAALGEPEVVGGRRVLHGRAFRELERRHPGISSLDSWIEAGGWRQAVRRARQTVHLPEPELIKPAITSRSWKNYFIGSWRPLGRGVS